MRRFLYEQGLLVLGVLFLLSFFLITLPVSHAAWREVLGIDSSMRIQVLSSAATSISTAVAPTVLGTSTTPQVSPGDLPLTDVPPETALPTTEPVITEAPSTAEPTATDILPTELPSEKITDTPTPEASS